jgi:hypothetical protein
MIPLRYRKALAAALKVADAQEQAIIDRLRRMKA